MARKVYRKTEIPGIFEEIRETVRKISLDRLRLKKEDLNSLIANYPEPKTRPDKEAMEFWNAMHVEQDQRRDLIKQREDIDSIITQLKALTNGKNDRVDNSI